MQKTLGGDRLGSGKKMKVDLHGYERSTHDLGYLWRSSMSAGTLVPFMSEIALPGDTFDINLNCEINTHPTIGPLFGSFKVQLDVFQAPIRLYNSLLHNNALGIGLNMGNVYFPNLVLDAVPTPTGITDIDNSQINPSCILKYLGISGVGITDEIVAREFNGVPLLSYWDIYKNYYANKQEQIGAVIHTPNVALVSTVTSVEIGGATITLLPTESPKAAGEFSQITINYTGAVPIPNQIIIKTIEFGEITLEAASKGNWVDTGTLLISDYNWNRYSSITILGWRYRTTADISTGQPIVTEFPLGMIDDMRNAILAFSSASPFDILDAGLHPYDYLQRGVYPPTTLHTQEGLAIKTYQSDLFNNWLWKEWIDTSTGINAITAIDTSSGEFTLDTLNLAKKVYDMLNRIAISGGTYDDWLDTVYDHERYTRCETPMYMGGLIKELVFQEVVSNSQNEDQPLGTLGGRGKLGQKHKGGNIIIKVDEPSYIIGIISLTPRIDYSQGNKWDINLRTMNDLHKPALDEIGFQDLITEQMAWWDTHWNSTGDIWVQKSAGKQPAWLNYMTNVNRVYGSFAIENNEMFMTLNRRYESEALAPPELQIKDLTTYIDPAKYNFIFAETALDAQNFWTQIAVDITARRKMSAKIMPNL